ncbi:Gfo/Idh/MocA family oxidoreductase [uncultured Cyclobacterium sp.]|uniref:Gfo/Idh/MocA family protein n=1 Tax=uncultured Cyclobacterium sp. TaxID=453820 RepID=UPI0030EB5925|tara:strand:+ start:550877 stop:551884 length:1008 start_codon:yes stop_codon:yes gene_type:complete
MKKFSSSQVNWGVIGAGSVCEKKSAPAMDKIKDSSVVAVMRRNAEKAKDYAERHGVPKWYSDADDLINDPEVNAVYIATPPGSHLELTRKAANAGKPVYVEKPMARNHEECLEMIKICEEAGVPLFVAYYRRTLPNFLKVKSLVEEGAIGEPRYLSVVIHHSKHPEDKDSRANNWRIDPAVAGGGYFYDLGSHQLDYFDFLFGPLKEVNGLAANQSGSYSAEDIVLGNFSFESGILGTGSWCFTTGETSQKDEIVIIGDKGEIRFPCFWGTSVTLKRDGKADEVFEFDVPENIQFFLIQSIVEELLGKGGKCPSTGISAARANWAMEQMTKNFNN